MKEIKGFLEKYNNFFKWQYLVAYYFIFRFLFNISYDLLYLYVVILLIIRTSFEYIALIFFVITIVVYILGMYVEANQYLSFVYIFLGLVLVKYIYLTIKDRFSSSDREKHEII